MIQFMMRRVCRLPRVCLKVVDGRLELSTKSRIVVLLKGFCLLRVGVQVRCWARWFTTATKHKHFKQQQVVQPWQSFSEAKQYSGQLQLDLVSNLFNNLKSLMMHFNIELESSNRSQTWISIGGEPESNIDVSLSKCSRSRLLLFGTPSHTEYNGLILNHLCHIKLPLDLCCLAMWTSLSVSHLHTSGPNHAC